METKKFFNKEGDFIIINECDTNIFIEMNFYNGPNDPELIERYKGNNLVEAYYFSIDNEFIYSEEEYKKLKKLIW